MSDTPLTPEELDEFLKDQQVVGGGLTFGQLKKLQESGTIPGGGTDGGTGGGTDGGTGGRQVILPEELKVFKVEELVVNGRKIRRTTLTDGTFTDEDLGPEDVVEGKKVTNVTEFVLDGRRIKRTTFSDGTFTDEDLGPSVVVPRGKIVSNISEIVLGGRKVKRTTYTDGTFTDEDLGPTDEKPDDDDDDGTTDSDATRAATDLAFLAQQRSDAYSRVSALLARFGLSSLNDAVKNILTSGAVDLNDANAIIFAIRGEPGYKARFAGNDARARKGLPELSAETYFGLEETYRQLMQSNGLPTDFYDGKEDFQKLIEGDVSPQELQERIEQGYRKVQDADPEVKRQMRELYGLGDGGLAAYFLDPEKSVTLLTRQARSAAIAARGRQQGGIDLTRESAEGLVARGITPEQAQAQFAQRGALAGLYNPLTGETALSQEEELGATFGYDVAATEKLKRRREQRVGEFQTGGGFARTSGVTSGTVETGVGTAT